MVISDADLKGACLEQTRRLIKQRKAAGWDFQALPSGRMEGFRQLRYMWTQLTKRAGVEFRQLGVGASSSEVESYTTNHIYNQSFNQTSMGRTQAKA